MEQEHDWAVADLTCAGEGVPRGVAVEEVAEEGVAVQPVVFCAWRAGKEALEGRDLGLPARASPTQGGEERGAEVSVPLEGLGEGQTRGAVRLLGEELAGQVGVELQQPLAQVRGGEKLLKKSR